MATLSEIFTNIANAIRSKKGTTNKILPSNMPTEIESIETGNGSGGGLTGYSGKILNVVNSDISSDAFKYGILEDGSVVSTYSATDKYIAVIINNKNTACEYIENCAVYEINTAIPWFYLVIPTANNWVIRQSMGGSND